MIYTLDCEFIEDGKTIDLISVALVSEEGMAFYMQSVDWSFDKASAWVRKNVVQQLVQCPYA